MELPEPPIRFRKLARRTGSDEGSRSGPSRGRGKRGPPGNVLARLRAVIATVPRGKVVTYGQVAAAGGFPGAARLTVWALQGGGALPWHRVVAAGGRIALPGDEGREQRLRLELERVTFRGDRVRMDRHRWIPRARGAPRRARSPRPKGRVRRASPVARDRSPRWPVGVPVPPVPARPPQRAGRGESSRAPSSARARSILDRADRGHRDRAHADHDRDDEPR
ncbi:MAG TPA: MGMT family protein [Thermoplasmata archaeon]|nr:MGMT family protein [Thermoplasmata archaeon]